jgi:hypothetical protein
MTDRGPQAPHAPAPPDAGAPDASGAVPDLNRLFVQALLLAGKSGRADELDSLPASKSFVLLNDHDPKPLYYPFDAEHPGQFSWDYIESGPGTWRLWIGKTA